MAQSVTSSTTIYKTLTFTPHYRQSLQAQPKITEDNNQNEAISSNMIENESVKSNDPTIKELPFTPCQAQPNIIEDAHQGKEESSKVAKRVKSNAVPSKKLPFVFRYRRKRNAQFKTPEYVYQLREIPLDPKCPDPVIKKQNIRIKKLLKHNIRLFDLKKAKEREQELIEEVKEMTNAHAMCELAELYLSGILGARDGKKAYHLFLRAANLGNSHAMSRISQLFSKGELVLNDQTRADEWMERAAVKGNCYALLMIAKKMLSVYWDKYANQPISYDELRLTDKICDYLQRSAERGNFRAFKMLSFIYEREVFGIPDNKQACKIYEKEIKKGNLGSLYLLVRSLSFEGLRGVLPKIPSNVLLTVGMDQLVENPLNGLKLIEKAASRDYYRAMLNLAKCYRDGIACDPDLKLAQYWFSRANHTFHELAKKRNVIALRSLGKLYLNGNGGCRDVDKAESYYKKAIDKSPDAEHIYELGVLYIEGRLGNKSPHEGEVLIKKAIDLWMQQVAEGNRKACLNLGLAFLNDYSCLKSEQEAIYWLQAAPDSDVEAQQLLAKIFLDTLSECANVKSGLSALEKVMTSSSDDLYNYLPILISSYNCHNLKEVISWLKHKAESNKSDFTSGTIYRKKQLKRFAIERLALSFEKGYFGEVDFSIASKYWYMLFTQFNSCYAGCKLVKMFLKETLPVEYNDVVKMWTKEISMRLEKGAFSFDDFIDASELYGELYHNRQLLQRDVKKAAKWKYFFFYYKNPKYYFDSEDYFDSGFETEDESEDDESNHDESDHSIDSDIEDYVVFISGSDTFNSKEELSKFLNLQSKEKKKILHELTQTAKHVKASRGSDKLIYRVLSRVLGDMYSDCSFLKPKLHMAIYWYTESSSMKNALAALALGKLYHHGIEKNLSLAIDWYEKSVEWGHGEALSILKSINSNEHTVDFNLHSFLNKHQHKSSVPLKELANVKPLKNLNFYPETEKDMFELGNKYLDVKCEDNENVIQAAYWFRKAMNKGHLKSAAKLSVIYGSDLLGYNVVSVAQKIHIKILKMCYSKIKVIFPVKGLETLMLSFLRDISSTLSLLVDDSTFQELKTLIDDIISSKGANNKIIEELLSTIKTMVAKKSLNK